MIDYAGISAIGDFTDLQLDASTLDYLAIDPSRCSGGGDAPLRTELEQAPGLDGALIFPPLDDAQIITLVGDIVIHSTGDSAGSDYRAAITTLYASLKTALDALKIAPDDLVFPAGSLKVWKNGPLDPTWTDFHICAVTFSLVVDVFA